MDTLKKQLDDIRSDAEKRITEILQEFVSKTGYVPLTINVSVMDITRVEDAGHIYTVNKVDLSYGQ